MQCPSLALTDLAGGHVQDTSEQVSQGTVLIQLLLGGKHSRMVLGTVGRAGAQALLAALMAILTSRSGSRLVGLVISST